MQFTDCPVHKLPYCPQRHVLFVNNYMLVCTKWREVRKILYVIPDHFQSLNR